MLLDVVDVTSWAVKSLLPTEAACKLAAVDSGREFFSLMCQHCSTGPRIPKRRNRTRSTRRKKKRMWLLKKGLGLRPSLARSIWLRCKRIWNELFPKADSPILLTTKRRNFSLIQMIVFSHSLMRKNQKTRKEMTSQN